MDGLIADVEDQISVKRIKNIVPKIRIIYLFVCLIFSFLYLVMPKVSSKGTEILVNFITSKLNPV